MRKKKRSKLPKQRETLQLQSGPHIATRFLAAAAAAANSH